jgi:tRNA pseudouridine38-40 synthase
MPVGDLHRALNALLPADVRVLAVEPCDPGFHARKSALGKLYRYVLDTGPVQVPTRRRTAAHVPWRLDEAGVRAVAALFPGRHDFAALASSGSSVKTTVRTVVRSEARFVAGLPDAPAGVGLTLVYEVEADGFLRRMVRSMVGGMIVVGRGGRRLEQLQDALEARDRSAWPAPAQARGLTLVRVTYPAPEGRQR